VSRGREIRRFLTVCLERLVRPRRLAVILHLQGESAGDAATLLGWDRKRVYNLTFRGLRDLRRCLAAQGVTP
jgi:DNA-directed RNA polymerase specialized sigma24 family protein